MGQRLNIEITKQDKLLANCYYHWSAYTSIAAFLTMNIIDSLDVVDKVDLSDIGKAIGLLEDTGATISDEELEFIKDEQEKYIIKQAQFNNFSNRNDGLIGISKEEMENTRSWEEGRVTVDLPTKKINFDCFWELLEENYEGFEEEYKSYIDKPRLRLPFDIHNCTIDEFKSIYENLLNNVFEVIENVDGTLYTIIY